MAPGGPRLKASRRQTDERLLVEAAQKDPAKFAAVYEANFARVYAYIACRVRDRATAEDLTSDVFHRALSSLAGFEWRGAPFAAWLYTIARNVIVDHSKRAVRERQASVLSDAPNSSLKETEQRARLFRLVERLPQAQRRIIEMRFAEGKSIREAARELGRSEGAVKQLQFRALSVLRTRMGKSNG
jgi:RNA polymerase sigma-70 factor, ECF subfamily